MSDFDLTIEQREDFVLLAPSGELDISTGMRFEEELQRVEAGGPERIVVDLRQLEFMDSTGIRILIGADSRARDARRRLQLIRGNEMLQRVLHVTRLDERFEIVETGAYAI